MKHRKTALAFMAAAMAFAGWRGAVEMRDQPLTELFNTQSTAAGPVREYRLPSLVAPEETKEIWRIRVGSWEMSRGGHHTFLEFAPFCEASEACPSAGDIYQIHGIAMDQKRRTFASLDFLKFSSYQNYFEGNYVLKALGVHEDFNKNFFNKKPDAYVDVFYGSKDEVLRLYMDAMKMTNAINRKSDRYKLLDQNSNSVQRTLLEGLGLNLPDIFAPHVLTKDSSRIWAPGFEVSLLPDGWDREKIRKAGGYGRLSGQKLERAALRVSRGAAGVWPDNKPPARGHNIRNHGFSGGRGAPL